MSIRDLFAIVLLINPTRDNLRIKMSHVYIFSYNKNTINKIFKIFYPSYTKYAKSDV